MDKALTTIVKWIEHKEWRDRCSQVVADRFGPVCDDFDIDLEDLAQGSALIFMA